MSTMAGLPLQTSNVNQFTNQSAARAAIYAQQPPTGMAMANKGPPRGGPLDKK